MEHHAFVSTASQSFSEFSVLPSEIFAISNCAVFSINLPFQDQLQRAQPSRTVHSSIHQTSFKSTTSDQTFLQRFSVLQQTSMTAYIASPLIQVPIWYILINPPVAVNIVSHSKFKHLIRASQANFQVHFSMRKAHNI